MRARGHVRPRRTKAGTLRWQAIVYAGKDPVTGRKKYVSRTSPTRGLAEAELQMMLTLVPEEQPPDLIHEANERARVAGEQAAQEVRVVEREIARSELRIRDGLAGIQAEAFRDGFDPHGCFVYCLWGEDPDRPLYVGQSTNVLARLGSHMSDRERRLQVRRITFLRCRDGRQMDKTEQRLIAKYQPVLNVIGIR